MSAAAAAAPAPAPAPAAGLEGGVLAHMAASLQGRYALDASATGRLAASTPLRGASPGANDLRLPRLPPAAAAAVAPMPPPSMPLAAAKQQNPHQQQHRPPAANSPSGPSSSSMLHSQDAESSFAEAWLDEVLAHAVRAHAAAINGASSGTSSSSSLASLLALALPHPQGGLTGQQRESRPDLEASLSNSTLMRSAGTGGDPYAALSRPGGGGGLRVFGLDRASLRYAGLTETATARLFRGLYIHSLALHRLVSSEASGAVDGGALVSRLTVGYRALVAALDQSSPNPEYLIARAATHQQQEDALLAPGELLAGMEYAAGEQERALADRGAWDLRMQLKQKAIEAERNKLLEEEARHAATRGEVARLERELSEEREQHADEKARRIRQAAEAEKVKQWYADSVGEWRGKHENERRAHEALKAQMVTHHEAHAKLELSHQQLKSLLADKKDEVSQLEQAGANLRKEVKLRDVRLEEQRKAYARDMQTLRQMKSSFAEVEQQRDAARELYDEETNKTAALKVSLEDVTNLSKRQAEDITQLRATIQANDRRIDEQTKTMSAQMKRIEALTAEVRDKESIKERLQFALDMNSSMGVRLDQATMALNDVQSEARMRVIHMARELRAAKAAQAELRETLQKSQRRIDDTRDAGDRARDDAAARQEQVADLTRQLDFASTAMAKAEAAADDFKGKLKHEKKRAERLDDELGKATVELKEVRRENARLEEEAMEVARANKEHAAQQAALLKESSSRLEAATAQNAKDEKELFELRPKAKELLRLVVAHRELKEKQATTMRELEKMRERTVGAEKRNDQYRKQHEADRAKIDELESRVAHFEAALEDEQRQHKQERERSAELRESLDSLTARHARLSEDHARLDEAHDRVVVEHAYEKERANNLSEKVGRLEVEMGELRQKCVDLETQRLAREEELKARVKASAETTTMLQRNLEVLRTEREELAASNAELTERLDALWSQLDDELRGKAAFAQQYAELNSMVGDMKSRIESESRKQKATKQLMDASVGRLQEELDANKRAVDEANAARCAAAEREAERVGERIAKRKAQALMQKRRRGSVSGEGSSSPSAALSTQGSLTLRGSEREKRSTEIAIDFAATIATGSPGGSGGGSPTRGGRAMMSTEAEARMQRLEGQLARETELREETETRADDAEARLAATKAELESERAAGENSGMSIKSLRAELSAEQESHADAVARLEARVKSEVAARKWREKYAADISDKLADAKRALQSLGTRKVVSTRATQTQYAELWTRSVMAADGTDKAAEFRRNWLQRVAGAEGAGASQRVMTAANLMHLITELYAEKVRHDAASARQGKEPAELPEFTHNFFFKRYGLPEPTEARLVEFVASVLAHQDVPEVAAFGLACGVLSEGGATGDPLKQPGASKLLSARDGAGGALDAEDEKGDGDDAEGLALVNSQLRHACIVRDSRLLGLNAGDLAHPLACNLVERVSKLIPRSLAVEDLTHPLADEANAALLATAGVEGLLRRIAADTQPGGACELLNADLGVMVQEEQLPQLHLLLLEAAELLHLEPNDMPQLYIKESPRPRAFLWDVLGRPPAVVLTSSLVDLLTPAEIQTAIAAQMALLGNPAMRHYAMAAAVADWRPRLGVLDASAAPGVRHALERWARFAALTGDRGALVVAQNVGTVAGAAIKIAAGSHTLTNELNVGALLEQARAMDAAAGAQLGRLLEPDGVGTLAHSTVILRARELDRWAQSEQLQSLLDGGERYVRSARFISAWT